MHCTQQIPCHWRMHQSWTDSAAIYSVHSVDSTITWLPILSNEQGAMQGNANANNYSYSEQGVCCSLRVSHMLSLGATAAEVTLTKVIAVVEGSGGGWWWALGKGLNRVRLCFKNWS